MTTQHDAILMVESGIPRADPILLGETVHVFGKSPSSDVVIDSPFVSRSHFQIRFDAGRFAIEDLGSKNGTYVNGQRLAPHQNVPLTNGDRIALADDQVVFRFHDSSETVTLGHGVLLKPAEIRVDPDSREVWIRGTLLEPPLSRKEFDVLSLLYQNRGKAISKDDIAEAAWPERPQGDVGNQEIEQCVRRLRRRIEHDPYKPSLVVTLRGYGYRMPLSQ